MTIAPITTSVRGVSTEVAGGPDNGVDHRSVISCGTIATIEVTNLGPQIGRLLPSQEILIARAVAAGFDLEPDLDE